MLSTTNMRLIFGQIKTNSKHEGVTVRGVKGGWQEPKMYSAVIHYLKNKVGVVYFANAQGLAMF